MSAADALWKMFRKFCLMDLNVKLNLKCSWTLSSSKYPRYRRLLYVVSLAIINILEDFPEAGNSENFVLECFWVFRFFSGLYLAVIEAIRTNKYEKLVSLWHVFLPIYNICHKTNYRLGDLSQILIHACLHPQVKRYLMKHRFVCLKNHDGHVDDDQACEICNGEGGRIPITVHGLLKWLETLPLRVYLQMNEKGNIVGYVEEKNANSSRCSLKKGRNRKWKIEDQVEECEKIIRNRLIELNGDSNNFDQFAEEELEKEKLSSFLKRTPFLVTSIQSPQKTILLNIFGLFDITTRTKFMKSG